MTAFRRPDRPNVMGCAAAMFRFLLLAAFSVSLLMPSMAAAMPRQQSDAAHGQMMSMPGHVGRAEAIPAKAADPSDILRCKQQCVVAAGILPGGLPEEAGGVSFDIPAGMPRTLGRSRTTPPPGPPPKPPMV